MTQSASEFSDLNDNGILDLDVYFDFLCPYSWQAAKWVCQILDLMGADVMAVRWRFFSFEQSTLAKKNSNFKIWEQKAGGQAQGVLPFAAGGAAHALGGEAALWKFYQALGRLRHEQGHPIWEPRYIEQGWQEAGLDNAALKPVLDGTDHTGLDKLKNDHAEGLEKYGIFGTPTLVFEEHRAFYFKMMPAPAELSDALELFQHVQRLAMGFSGAIHEFKRPHTKQDEADLEEMVQKSHKGLNILK